MLVNEFLVPLGLTQMELARRLRVPFQRVNQLCNQRRSVTSDTALRLSRLLGTTPDFWLGLQQRWDLYGVMRSKSAGEIRLVRPLQRRAS